MFRQLAVRLISPFPVDERCNAVKRTATPIKAGAAAVTPMAQSNCAGLTRATETQTDASMPGDPSSFAIINAKRLLAGYG